MVAKFITPPPFSKLIRAAIVCGALVLTNMNAIAQNDNASPSATGANWKSNGNAATTSDFIGTTNEQDLIFKTNNQERLILDKTGNLILKDRINPGGGGGEIIISPGLFHRSIPTNPIAAYMLKVGGSGIFEGEVNAKQLFVEEYITFMKYLKGPRIDVDTIKMDSTRGIYGNTKVIGDLTVKQNLTVDGEALFRSKIIAEQGITFDGIKGLRKTTTASGNVVYKLGDPISIDPVVPCEFPAQSEWFYFGGKIQLYDEGSNTSLTMGSDGYQSVIESAGNNKLLLNWYCGKDISLCTGANTTSSNGRGGVVRMGHNVMIGGPWPANNYDIALNVNGVEQTGLFVKSVNTTNQYNYGVVSSVYGLNNKAYAVLLQNDNNDKEVISLRGNGEAFFGTLSATIKPTLYVSPSIISNQFVTGKVGIGTNTPSTALTVKGDITISDFGDGTVRTLLVDGTGKLVPGTASSTTATAWNLGGNNITNPATEWFGTSAGSNQPIDFYTNGNRRMRLDENGHFVIGYPYGGGAETEMMHINAFNQKGFISINSSTYDGSGTKNSGVIISNDQGNIVLKQDVGSVSRLGWITGPASAPVFSSYMSFRGESILIGTPDANFEAGNTNTQNTKLVISTTTQNGYTPLPFKIVNSNFMLHNQGTVFEVMPDGTTHIGNTKPTNAPYSNAKLAVDGSIIAKEIFVRDQQGAQWADYVFAKDYKLMPLKEVEKYVAENKHLPNVPSAKEIDEKGQGIGALQVIQMEKIEELYLHMIELNKKLEKLEKENEELKAKIRN